MSVRTQPRVAIPVPTDPSLPLMGHLLDTNEIAPILGRSLREPQGLSAVEPIQIRYRPGMHFVVRYRAKIGERASTVTVWTAANRDLARRSADPTRRSLAMRAADRAGVDEPLRFDQELGVLVQWFPLDIHIPALVGYPERLALDVVGEDAYVPGTSELLAYKPRRRAALRTGNVVLKLYANAEHYFASAVGLAFSRSLGEMAPTFMGNSDRDRLTAQQWVEGCLIADAATRIEAGRTVFAAMRAHGSSTTVRPPDFPPASQLGEALRAGSIAKVLVPELSARIDKLLARLEGDLPQGLAARPAHGDLIPGQIIDKNGGGIAVVDFDACCLAPPALDPATFAASFIGSDDIDGPGAEDVLDLLVHGDDEARAGLRWYFATAILRRAPRPFRHVCTDWPERVSAIVSAAEHAFAR